MFEGRLMRRIIGSAILLFATLMMLGIGGAVESGSVSVGMAFVRMIIGCLMILFGAALFGGLE